MKLIDCKCSLFALKLQSNQLISILLLLLTLKLCTVEAIDQSFEHKLANDDTNWLNRLLINLFSYALILIPSALLVFTVKNGFCLKSVSENFLIKLFVFGKNETIIEYNYKINDCIESDLNEKLLPLTIGDTKDGKSGPKTVGSVISSAISWTRTGRITLLLYCFIGLQVSYLSWGLLQEKIMTTEYVIQSQFFASGHKHFAIAKNFVTISSHLPKDEQNVVNSEDVETAQTYHIKFRNSQFLVLINRILAFFIAFIALQVKNRRNKPKSSARSEPPLHQYIYCSLSNILSSWCQYEALKFVSFPTQVLSKACKIMPVMLMSQVVGGKRYRTVEYLFAISISFGMTIFLWSDHSVRNSHQLDSTDSSDSGVYYGGLVILILYLTFDSFTSNWQTVLFDRYKMSTLHMMAAVNFFSILLTSTSLIEQGDLTPAFHLVLHNHILLTDCILLSVFSAAGQLFVFYTISTFGALVFVTIMTLRQAIAILLSCLVYNHSLAPLGLIGIVIVFATLFTQIYWKSKSKSKR